MGNTCYAFSNIYIACKDSEAIAYMTVELADDNRADSIEIQVE